MQQRTMAAADVAVLARALEGAVLSAFVGSPDAVKLSVAALLAGLHALVEDIPGVGKTTLALSLSRAAGLGFSRIQFTPDLLPGDVLGMNVWDPSLREFVFKRGPLSAQFVLADELNRASPRTQAAFLEAMQEGRVTVDGVTTELPAPFFFMGTQNPQGFGGTFPLPEAELDRFGLSFSLGYPASADEAEILARWSPEGSALRVEPVACAADIASARAAVLGVKVGEAVRAYIVAVARATRSMPEVKLGASPRAAAALQQASRARAACEGRSFVVPEDVEAMAGPVLAHRLVLSSQARIAGTDAVRLARAAAAAVPKPTGL